MTISAVSAANASPVSNFQTFRQALNQLTGALNSNDASAAQDAYSQLASSPLAQGNSPFAQAIQKIGQDLQNGDLAGAQKDLAALQQAHGHHHHHGGASSDVSNSSGGNNDADGGGVEITATSIQIQITVTGQSGNPNNQVDVTA